MADSQSIEGHLSGMEYPASKQEIIEHAQQQEAPEEILSRLRQLPERQFHGMNEISQAVGAME